MQPYILPIFGPCYQYTLKVDVYCYLCTLSLCAGAPPTYVSTVGYPGSFGPQQPQQPLALAGYHSSDAVGRQPPAVYGGGDMMLPAKQ